MTTQTIALRTVKVFLDGRPHAMVRVSSTAAQTDEAAVAWAIECAARSEAVRAFQVAQSGGPAWAAEARPADAFTATVARRIR